MFKRQNIAKSGLQGLAEKYINDNFINLFSKVSGGNINYTDLDTPTQNKINTQFIPFQGEGNVDANFPLEIRFYIPPNIKEIKGAKLSAVASNYRMDSDIALSDELFQMVDLQIAMGGNTTVVGTTSTNGGGAITDSFFVEEWGTPPYQYPAPGAWVYNGGAPDLYGISGGFVRRSGNTDTLGTLDGEGFLGGVAKNYADLKNFQHTHKVITSSHSHSISGAAMSHSHEGYAKLELPKHSHKLNTGIKVSTSAPGSVEIQINDTKVGRVLSGTNDTINDIDILKQCKMGWNIAKVIASNPSRITLYGVAEVVINAQYISLETL